MKSIGSKLNIGLDVFITTLHFLVIVLTSLRLYYRKHTQRLWWDDYTAGLAIFVDLGLLPLLWLAVPPDSAIPSPVFVNAGFWTSIMFFLVIWCTRASMALAIARVFPPGDVKRRFAIGLAFLFAIFYTAITIRFAILCSPNLKLPNPSICPWTADLVILVTTANVVSDTLLVATPLYTLWHVRLPPKQRRLILAGFSASLMTTVATAGCITLLFAPKSWQPLSTIALPLKISYLEIAISLTACNLLVVIAWIYNARRRREESVGSVSSETCETRGPNLAPLAHSNQARNSSAPSTLILTEISEQYFSETRESYPLSTPSGSLNDAMPSTNGS